MDEPPYEVTTAILNLYGKISERIGQCKGDVDSSRGTFASGESNKDHSFFLGHRGNPLEIEQVTAILEDKRVIAPAREILEVQNAILAYDKLSSVDPLSENDF